jgi:hypothetical protein
MALGQGCSDAGFCTINSIKPSAEKEEFNTPNQLTLGISFGKADNKITVLGQNFEYNRMLSDAIGIDIKLTSLAQSGNGISEFGVSDVYVSGNYAINSSTKFTLGFKVPFTDGNKKKDNLALPMDYQSSLGTTDVLFGIGQTFGKLQTVLAVQQPITQNQNGFLATQYNEDSALRKFQSTQNFKRKGDVLLRLSYPLGLSDNIKIIPSVLPIYHLGNDQYTDNGTVYEITGSNGLTVNANIYVDFSINTKSNLQLSLGAPLVVRKTRPDGLTRAMVASLDYRFRF